MENLKKMKECLVGMVESQVYGNIDKVDAQELGAAVDMIKDLAEAIYYCTITEAMEEGEEEGREGEKGKHGMMYYSRTTPPPHQYPIEMYDPRLREKHMPMYAQGNGGGSRYYQEGRMPMEEPWYPMYNDGMNGGHGGNRYQEKMRDPREGRSGERRKMYMEGQGSKDKTHQMKELENYMQELSQDLTEMIQDASPEEKSMLQQKITLLATKIK